MGREDLQGRDAYPRLPVNDHVSKKGGMMSGEVCSERTHRDSKHEWMPYRWRKEATSEAGTPERAMLTVMKLGEVVCKYCLEKRAV